LGLSTSISLGKVTTQFEGSSAALPHIADVMDSHNLSTIISHAEKHSEEVHSISVFQWPCAKNQFIYGPRRIPKISDICTTSADWLGF
ncbi:hypothetical protein OFC49_35465, partial [Escherichia coli]|nr:hypothetical protein [Escherichia coli]